MCDVGCEQVPNKHVICQYDSIVMISHFRKNQKIPKTKIWFKELSKRCILLSELRSLSKIQGNISKKAIEFRVLLLHITPPPPPPPWIWWFVLTKCAADKNCDTFWQRVNEKRHVLHSTSKLCLCSKSNTELNPNAPDWNKLHAWND